MDFPKEGPFFGTTQSGSFNPNIVGNHTYRLMNPNEIQLLSGLRSKKDYTRYFTSGIFDCLLKSYPDYDQTGERYIKYENVANDMTVIMMKGFYTLAANALKFRPLGQTIQPIVFENYPAYKEKIDELLIIINKK